MAETDGPSKLTSQGESCREGWVMTSRGCSRQRTRWTYGDVGGGAGGGNHGTGLDGIT